MGASQSTQSQDTSIQFSPAVVAQLSDNVASPGPSPQRQTSLDAHVRARIQAELDHLRAEEVLVRSEIEHALKKENLDKEKALQEGANSISLLGDLEQIQEKVHRTKQKQDQAQVEAARVSAESVVSCYRNNATHPLDCWKEVATFKQSIAHLEQEYIKSLH